MNKLLGSLAGLLLSANVAAQSSNGSEQDSSNFQSNYAQMDAQEKQYDQVVETNYTGLVDSLDEHMSNGFVLDPKDVAILDITSHYDDGSIVDSAKFWTRMDVPYKTGSTDLMQLANVDNEVNARRGLMKTYDLLANKKSNFKDKTLNQQKAVDQFFDRSCNDFKFDIYDAYPVKKGDSTFMRFELGGVIGGDKKLRLPKNDPYDVMFKDAGYNLDSVDQAKVEAVRFRPDNQEKVEAETPITGLYTSLTGTTVPGVQSVVGYDFGKFRLGAGVGYQPTTTSTKEVTSTSQDLPPNMVYTTTTTNKENNSRDLSIVGEAGYDINNNWNITARIGVGPTRNSTFSITNEKNTIDGVLVESGITDESNSSKNYWDVQNLQGLVIYNFNNGLGVGAGVQYQTPTSTSEGQLSPALNFTYNFGDNK